MTSRAQTVFLCFVAENGYRIYASDLRGHGLSVPQELAASMAQMVAVAAWQFSTHQSGEKHWGAD
ncbi:MAG: hypothetical protein WBO12_04240 [Xanthobacteraceae bacterium]|jgi:pimeloyl-ACP methyl ester carboxylesterase